MKLAAVVRENIAIYTYTHTHLIPPIYLPPTILHLSLAVTSQISISAILSFHDHCVVQHVILGGWLFFFNH